MTNEEKELIRKSVMSRSTEHLLKNLENISEYIGMLNARGIESCDCTMKEMLQKRSIYHQILQTRMKQ